MTLRLTFILSPHLVNITLGQFPDPDMLGTVGEYNAEVIVRNASKLEV
jgi:hypothetical protein